jgi:6-phosphogluconolactonase
LGALETVAEAYEQALRKFFENSSDDSFPAFDLILLGMGEDGHTASLFPGDPALKERKRWVAAVPAPPTPPHHPRITLTVPALNSARQVNFLVSGPGKKPVVRAILEDSASARERYPAAMVHPKGQTVWFVDHSARGEDLR